MRVKFVSCEELLCSNASLSCVPELQGKRSLALHEPPDDEATMYVRGGSLAGEVRPLVLDVRGTTYRTGREIYDLQCWTREVRPKVLDA